MNHDIFISYSSKQKSIADGVCHYLEENGFKCWMAPRDIPVGSEYGDLIEEAIKTSKVVVLVFSQAASISKWVKGEINVAFTEDKPILPFRIDETEIKGGFRVMLNQMHWVDAFPHYSDRLPDLLNSISGFLGRQPQKVSNEGERLEAERKAKEAAESERRAEEDKRKAEQERIERERMENEKREAEIFRQKSIRCPEGAINGVFSVSPTKKVYFSQGNLQYQASTSIWRFAERQFDIIGKDNEKISLSYDGWIDLFGWGTGNDPTNCKEWNYDYKYFADWAVNLISNGGNKVDLWHTLSSDEWKFVLKTRKTLSGIRYVKANVCGVNGVILIPDGWKSGDYCFNQTNDFESDFKNNLIDALQWLLFEQKGIVFLPAAGYRSGSSVLNERWYGNYWSASSGNDDYASYLCFNSSNLSPSSVNNRFDGRSVRPVCSAE